MSGDALDPLHLKIHPPIPFEFNRPLNFIVGNNMCPWKLLQQLLDVYRTEMVTERINLWKYNKYCFC